MEFNERTFAWIAFLIFCIGFVVALLLENSTAATVLRELVFGFAGILVGLHTSKALGARRAGKLEK